MRPDELRIKHFHSPARYAVSTSDPDAGRYTMIEGDSNRARAISVDGDEWAEALIAPFISRAGVGMRIAVYKGTPDKITATSRTLFRDGATREDWFSANQDQPLRRTTKWALPTGITAQSEWTTTDGELVIRDSAGEVTHTVRARFDPETGYATSEFADAFGEVIGQTQLRVSPGSLLEAVTSTAASADGPEFTVYKDSTTHITRQDLGNGAFRMVSVQALADGVETYIVDTKGSSMNWVHDIIDAKSGGSLHHESFTETGNPSDGTTVVQISGPSGSTPIPGMDVQSSSWTGRLDGGGHTADIGVVNNYKDGSSDERHFGVNASGEGYKSGSFTDAEGNSSTTTETTHADGGFTITTVTKDSNGNVTIDSADYDKDGNPKQDNGGQEKGGNNGEGKGGDEGQGKGGDDGEGKGGDDGDGKGGDEGHPDGGGDGGDDGMPVGDGDDPGAHPTSTGIDGGPPPFNFGIGGNTLDTNFGSPLTVNGPIQPAPGGYDGPESKIGDQSRTIGTRLQSDVEEGGNGLDPNGSAVIDIQQPAGSWATEGDRWRKRTDPGFLVQPIEFITGGNSAAALAQAAADAITDSGL